MSDYGEVQAVIVSPRGSTLTTAAGVADVELLIDSAQDFDSDGGTLDLDGVRLQYTSITEGTNASDPDTVNLAGPLAAGADEDTNVAPVVGGQIPEDWYAVITMGEEGDVAHVPLDVDQRAQWPVGEYPDPVPVIVSDDLQHLEDAPGRTVSTRNAFINTDEYTYDGIAADIQLPLTKIPISGSEQPFWKAATVAVGGIGLPPGTWRIESGFLVVDDPDLMAEFEVDDLFWVHYAYDAAADDISRPENAVPLTIGNPGDLSILTSSYQNAAGLYLVAGIDGQVVSATDSGTLTTITIGSDPSPTISSGGIRFVTGSLSGLDFTVTDITSLTTLPSGTTFPTDIPVTLSVNEGDYLAIYQPETGAMVQVAYLTTGSANDKLGYATVVGGPPSPSDVITLLSIDDNTAISAFGTDDA